MMDINQYLYLPTWEEIEEELEKEVNFMELFNSDKVVKYSIDLHYIDTFVEIDLDELLEVLEDELIQKILKKTFNFIEIEIVLKDDLTELEKDKIYELRSEINELKDLDCYDYDIFKIIHLEAYQNLIYIYIKKLNKQKVLDFFSKLYEILNQ